ncbi:hypothetical protein JDV02_000270 [Purpureocillium takamizusanense]|uniref:Uncharacterized protein n=1 Tax=Purpureocillium takamizusanense TaxID=2060973 RepID=A0A9Q8V679_9HYPO|nr:uncharacterized protein JDV02_000270 [Purpureocillium takamizusanense]UNI13532.1 hypothetical protein JDV02_000270 [Purpureocillium takamizusanense]
MRAAPTSVNAPPSLSRRRPQLARLINTLLLYLQPSRSTADRKTERPDRQGSPRRARFRFGASSYQPQRRRRRRRRRKALPRRQMLARLSQVARHVSGGPTTRSFFVSQSLRHQRPSSAVIAAAAIMADERRTRTIHTAACLIIGDEVLGGKTVDVSRAQQQQQQGVEPSHDMT